MALYEITVQVVPVLMIALFLDTRTAAPSPGGPAVWPRVLNRAYIVLCVGAFVVSLLIVAGVFAPGRVTAALVIGALVGCISLMAAQAWTRFDTAARRRRDG